MKHPENKAESTVDQYRRLVSFSKVIPFKGIPHAGGEYVLRHLEALAPLLSISLVAPAERRNIEASSAAYPTGCEYSMASQSFQQVLNFPIVRKFISFYKKMVPFSSQASLWIELVKNPALKKLVRNAEIIEFQWSENAALIPLVLKLNKTAHLIVVSHDVLSQKYERVSDAQNSTIGRVIHKLIAHGVRKREAGLLSQADDVIVFSNKDKQLLSHIETKSRIHVVNPPLVAQNIFPIDKDNLQQQTVLFTGAFSRPENDQAAIWLLNEVWPLVLEESPDAQLILAGSNPSTVLCEIAKAYSNVVITGYVETLDSYYARATCFVAPIFSGAGVKFKVITALAAGIPTISTPVGAEGIGNESCYVAVTDKPARFAEGILSVLRQPRESFIKAKDVQLWARQAYGETQFTTKLQKIYCTTIDNSNQSK